MLNSTKEKMAISSTVKCKDDIISGMLDYNLYMILKSRLPWMIFTHLLFHDLQVMCAKEVQSCPMVAVIRIRLQALNSVVTVAKILADVAQVLSFVSPVA